MAVKMNWSFNIQVAGGPKITGTDTLEVDAYDTIEVTVAKKGGAGNPATVQVQPGGAGKVRLLVIKSSLYKDLTYKVDGAGGDINLDAPQVLIGAGAVGLLAGPPQSLIITNNNTTTEATVQILVGRQAK